MKCAKRDNVNEMTQKLKVFQSLCETARDLLHPHTFENRNGLRGKE